MIKQRGFTITEILVAVAIGLISTLVIFKALQSSNIIANNVTGGSDSNQAGMIGLYSIERDIRSAGYGINYPETLGCQMSFYSTAVTPNLNTMILAPAFITPGDRTVANSPDTIRVAYSGFRSVAPSYLQGDYSGNTSTLAVDNKFDIVTNSVLLLAEVRNGSSDTTTCPGPIGEPCQCVVYQVPVAPTSSTLSVTGGILNNPSNFGLDYKNQQAKLFSLGTIAAADKVGDLPTLNEYTVNSASRTLNVRNMYLDPTPVVIASNIVNMYADYLLNDGTFTNVQPTNQNEWEAITGVRLALLSRSATPDFSQGTICKTDPNDAKTVTTSNSPTLRTSFGHTFLIGGPDANCYRYKIHETTVTMRNMVWRAP